MTVCLHVGLHKTGTSSIQAVLSAAHDSLLRHGVEFPLLGDPPVSPKAHRHFAAYLRDRGRIPPETRALIEAWRPTQPRTVISAEGFSHGEPEMIERARAYFGPDVHVICALRDPVSHIVSHHHQKSGSARNVATLSDYVAGHHAEMIEAPEIAYYAYDAKIARWSNAFRTSTLTYRGDGDMVDAFLRVAEFEGMLGDYSAASKRRNVSIAPLTAAVMRVLTRVATANRLEREAVVQTRKAIRKRQPLLQSALMDYAVDEAVDMRPFKADFARLNPTWAHLLEGSPDTATSGAGFSIDDDAVMGIVSEVTGHRL